MYSAAICLALVALLAHGGFTASTRQQARMPVTNRLAFIGEVRQQANFPPTPGVFLWNDAKVLTSSWRGTWNWLGSPTVQLIDARSGTPLLQKKMKGPCTSDYSFSRWQAIPNSTDLLVTVCGHVLLIDGTTLEKKSDLTAKAPPGEKLWSASAIVSPNGKRVVLDVSYETRNGTRMALRVLRTSDWQEEGSWQYGTIESGRINITFTPRLITLDGERLVVWRDRGLRVLRLPSGDLESDIDLDVRSDDPGDFVTHVLLSNPDEIVMAEKKSGTVWTIHLKDGVRERRAQLEDWPKLGSYYQLEYGISPDGNWLCAPNSDPVVENVPAFSVWSTVTGRVWAVGDRWSFSPAERQSASRYLSEFGTPILSRCQAAPDGKHVMLELYFGWLSRSRIFEVFFQD